MFPLTYCEQIIRMKDKGGKFDLRLRMVLHAIRHGVRPTTGVFDTTPKTVRKMADPFQARAAYGVKRAALNTTQLSAGFIQPDDGGCEVA
jgi:hypothetical protein